MITVTDYNGNNPVVHLFAEEPSQYQVLDEDGLRLDMGILAPQEDLLIEVAPGTQVLLDAQSTGAREHLITVPKKVEEMKTAATRRVSGIRLGV